MVNPYDAPSAELQASPLDDEPLPKPKGIGRLVFLIGIGCIAVLNAWLRIGFEPFIFASNAITIATSLFMLLLCIAAFFKRMQNIGVNGFWGLFCVVPLIGYILFAVCLVLPPGYRHHRKLDTASIAAIVFVGLLVSLAIVVFGYFALGSIKIH